MEYFKKGIFLGIGFVFVLGSVLAATTIFSVNTIPIKEAKGIVSFDEFNTVVGTMKNIYNDNINNRIGIGSGASVPQATLDIDGNLSLRGITGCNKLGTTAEGQIICK